MHKSPKKTGRPMFTNHYKISICFMSANRLNFLKIYIYCAKAS